MIATSNSRLAISNGSDAVVNKARGAAPDGDIAVFDTQAADGIAAPLPAPEEDGGKSERDGDNGGPLVLLVLVLMKAELGLSLVEYRNQVRLDRLQALIAGGERNLRTAARAAGFGSYAQFHRVVRAAHATAPRDYLRTR